MYGTKIYLIFFGTIDFLINIQKLNEFKHATEEG